MKCVAALLLCASLLSAQPSPPVTQRYCSGCHNDKNKTAGFTVTSTPRARSRRVGEGRAQASRKADAASWLTQTR